MHTKLKKIALLIIISPFSIYAYCSTECDAQAICTRPALLSLGAGIWNVFPGKDHMTQYQLEYKWSACWKGVQPFASFLVTDRGSLYFCLGACYDIFLGSRFVLTPSFAPGLYIKNGGKDLGYPLEFRSSIALSYQFCNCNRFGVQFYHISNASLGDKNPGTECLVFFYGIAL